MMMGLIVLSSVDEAVKSPAITVRRMLQLQNWQGLRRRHKGALGGCETR